MSNVIAFPRRGTDEDDIAVDLLTAVDAAIRDLREIAARSRECREQADDCRRLLERAYQAALDD
jgi:hypothetical protein